MPWEKQFDVDIALRKAGEAFWAHGYEATSVQDLLTAMGIQKGSFYDTYGSKRQTYVRALNQYLESRAADMLRPDEREPPRRSIEIHFDDIVEECVGAGGHRGCMAINGAIDLGHSDAEVQQVVRRAFIEHEKFFRNRIEAAQVLGDVSSDVDAAATAKAMFAIVVGMRVHARTGAPEATLRTLADQAVALIN